MCEETSTRFFTIRAGAAGPAARRRTMVPERELARHNGIPPFTVHL